MNSHRMVTYYASVIANTEAYLQNPPRPLSEDDKAIKQAVIAEAKMQMEHHRAHA